MKFRKQIDLKHSIEGEIEITDHDADIVEDGIGDPTIVGPRLKVNLRLIKHTNGQAIDPDSEPVALFRSRDRLMVPMLVYYRELCRLDGCNDFQLGQIDELIAKSKKFAEANPDVMKQPGITRGA